MNGTESKPLYRSSGNRIIGGVCSGLGEYFLVDPLVFRIIFILLAVFGGSGVILYIILWILIPEKDEKRSSDMAENIKTGANKMASEIRDTPETNNNARIIGGVVIILIGVVFLLQEYVPNLNIGFDKLWPLVVIAIGISLIKKPNRKKIEQGSNKETK